MPIETASAEKFSRRHIGPDEHEIRQMLEAVGARTLDEFIQSVVPPQIRTQHPLHLDPPLGEYDALNVLQSIAAKNHLYRSLIGMGYYGTMTPPVIQRNILENPGWYTQYTPYQAEIAQVRLEVSQFPNDGDRSDRTGNCQRIVAR